MISHKYFCDSAAIGILEKKLTKLYEMDVAEKSFSVLFTKKNAKISANKNIEYWSKITCQ